ncbi:hypothetical protein [Lysobacter sp. Hz 25]|uniref:hypothetical protein n=1 Tax=Lysobacter sp. Hz 25 TaxID=3383698 RepID=UPI0038D3BFBB
MSATPIYLHDWAKSGFEQLVSDFAGLCISAAEFKAESAPYANVEFWNEERSKLAAELENKRWKGVEILLASYAYECYSGNAFVLFRHDGNLYEVNGSHCSCYGLEGQWSPEETTAAALRHRVVHGDLGGYGDNRFADELLTVLDRLERAP